MEKERRKTDLLDVWIEKDEEPSPIHEGDIVLLHSWDEKNENQIIGVAEVVWDINDHGWNFKTISGGLEDSDDYELMKWYQSPMVIGNTKDGLNKEFLNKEKELFKTNESWLDSNAWEKYFQKSAIKQQIKDEKKILRGKVKKQKEFENKTDDKLIELEGNIDDSKEIIRDFKMKLTTKE